MLIRYRSRTNDMIFVFSEDISVTKSVVMLYLTPAWAGSGSIHTDCGHCNAVDRSCLHAVTSYKWSSPTDAFSCLFHRAQKPPLDEKES